jgi:acetoacetyl-CoA synthetase
MKIEMNQIEEGTLLWEPSEKVRNSTNLAQYMRWLDERRDLYFKSYAELWIWSVSKPADFWQSIWDYFDIRASSKPTAILPERSMPGATWFPGARLNYAENIFARMKKDGPVILYQAEDEPLKTFDWSEIYSKTNSLAMALRSLGVQPGDRVVAFMPNIPETIIALLAVASLGAIWSSCSPDFGSRSVLDRFQQIEPKVLLAVDGYRYNGKTFDRREVLADLQENLPTLEKTILVPLISDGSAGEGLSNAILWDDFLAPHPLPAEIAFEQVTFDHPLWVLYSSGTTGLPKPIVQGQGGILLEHLKMAVLHLDLKPEDRFFWYTSTGWMMWNFLVGGLLAGASIAVYDGSPGYPDLMALWQLAAEIGITYFGTSAAFITACMKAGIKPSEQLDLSRIRAVGSTGSPLTVEGFLWVYENVNRDLALESVSGGTDLCTAFVCGCRLLPIYAGEIQGPALGAKVEAFDEGGQPIVGRVGELVISQPMPSMPLYFWNDPGNWRYQASYFEMYPGIWRHGDWIKFTEHGGCIIYGRSDSTINRQGIRMGTSEIYRVVESFPEIEDSLVVDLELLGRESFMPLFVVLQDGLELDEDLQQRIKRLIRTEVSPRHVPDKVYKIDQVPYTLSGKKMEVPIRRILLGQDPESAANPGAMRNPESIDFFVELEKSLPEVTD